MLLDITIGGRLSFLYRSIVTGNNSYERKKSIVEAGLKFSIWKIGANIGTSSTTETITQLNTKNSQWKCTVEYNGGTNSGRSDTFSSGGGYSTTINQAAWEQSVTANNAALVDIGWQNAIPIWEFVEDSTKREQIKNAAIQYIESRQLEMVEGEEMVPIYRFYIPWVGDYLFSYQQEMLMGYGYQLQELVGYAYKNQMPGTIPLYFFKRNYGKNFQCHAYTTDRNDSHLLEYGYTYAGINCYVPAESEEDGVIRMTEYCKKQGGNRFWHSYSSTGTPSGYYYNRPGFKLFTK
ncbi:MAG: hypothetical protein LBN24_04460 [Mediterranea sp.]|nr:hypothetical protein [Mediterranea sp.]